MCRMAHLFDALTGKETNILLINHDFISRCLHFDTMQTLIPINGRWKGDSQIDGMPADWVFRHFDEHCGVYLVKCWR